MLFGDASPRRRFAFARAAAGAAQGGSPDPVYEVDNGLPEARQREEPAIVPNPKALYGWFPVLRRHGRRRQVGIGRDPQGGASVHSRPIEQLSCFWITSIVD